MATTVHFIVEKGPAKGQAITVPSEGGRVGRSSKNDITLLDPSMSRHHSRFLFRDGVLHIVDLGSANQTLVNGTPVTESKLKAGDEVALGESVLRVVQAGPAAAAGGLDLGLQPQAAPVPTATARESRPTLRRALLMVAAAVLVIAVVSWIPRLLPKTQPAPPRQQTAPQPVRETLEINYEKVEATVQNIFRYHFLLTADHRLSVQIDDILNDRHVRKEAKLDPDYARNLADTLVDSGFFGLAEDYQGIQPDVYDSWDLAITAGPRTHRVRVVNRVEPDAFRRAREIIEECGKNELGLWAIQFSPEKLLTMAAESFLEGKRLFDARDVAVDNLAASVRAFDEAQWYLETVEPKPDYYADMLTALNQAREELDRRFRDRNFRAERAIRHRQWREAVAELRAICDMIPDRSDERHQQARQKLLDIENRLRLES